MRIFSGVYIECEELHKELEKLPERECHISEGGCRAMLNHALESPMPFRIDDTLKAVAVQVMSMKRIDAQELNRILLHRLLDKSKQYGDTMKYPIRAFTEASIIEHINLKVDDKLCIVYNSVSEVPDTVYLDILCYLILHKTFIRMNDEKLHLRHKIKNNISIGAVIIGTLMFLSGLACMAFKFCK
jgi:hypothetical protein